MTRDRVRKAFLLLLVASVSAVFLVMLRSFLVTILMAAIFSGLLYPSYEDLVARLRSRALAATVTVLCTLVLVIAPLLLVLHGLEGAAWPTPHSPCRGAAHPGSGDAGGPPSAQPTSLGRAAPVHPTPCSS